MAELTEQIVDLAATHEPPPGWIHTPRVRGEEKRLEAMVKSNSHIRAPSMQKTVFDASIDLGEGEEGSGEIFLPGTFVEVRRNELATHCVVLGQVLRDSRWHVICMTTTGEIWDPLSDDIMFVVPGLVSSDLAYRCSMLDIVTESSQLQARIKVLQHIRQVERAVEGATSEILRLPTPVYDIVKSQKPDEWATTNVMEVARLFSPKPTLVNIFAVHKFLMSRPEHYTASHSYRTSQSFHPDGPLVDFAHRALPIIEANRRLHHETRNGIPSQRPANYPWSQEDLTIIEFLHQSLRPTRSIQRDPYSIGQSAIIRKLSPHTAVNDHEVHMTLVDLGVYAPWQDLFSRRMDLKLDQEDPSTSPKVKAIDDLVKRSLSSPPPARGEPLGPEDFYHADPLDRLRHDFGDLPVYVVDDSHAQELDDGFSVEAVAGEPDSYWVHVHIADPASTIPPTHILATMAAKQSQSSYFIHRTWPLFPKSLMFSGRAGFSLSEGAENRVLTFSSKVNASGEVVDSVVRPGITRKVVKLAYDDVDLALTGALMPRFYPFSLPPATPPVPQLPAPQVADLRIMDMLRTRLMDHRLRLGIIESNNEVASITKFATPRNIESPSMRGSQFTGFPQFSYSVSTFVDGARGARGMVAEAMKLACRSASRWCVERGVEILFRTASPLEATPDAFEKLSALRDDAGYVDVGVVTEMAASMPTADYSLTPGAHWSMGVPEGEGYTRATSPLRRFSDLLVHYQIHRNLLGERPHFDTAYLEEYKSWLKSDDRLKRRTDSLHLRSWVLVALRRWMAAPRSDVADPLADLHAVLMRPPRHNTRRNSVESEVRIPALGIAATLVDIPADFHKNWVISRSVRVKIKEVQLGVRPSLKVILAN
ncbi:hypothetical protein DFH09DRAFT_1331543 [Mycena vulgaris]|nr:hypothetical protein DFH09DRAFT_1331543 [Mycena vulgaris]